MRLRLKNLAIVLLVIIIVLLGILFFYKPANGPTIPPAGTAASGTGAPATSTLQN